MGCASSSVYQATMSWFRKNSNDARVKLERKLYIAKESPVPDFDLSDCELHQIPTGIFSICKVFRKDNLYLQNNHLHSLDDGGQLSDLHLIKILNLSFNEFTQLPNNIRYLVSVTELYINNNLLKLLPEGIQYMESLQILDVSFNKLTNLTPLLGDLKFLRKLIINGNGDLKELCTELCLARNLSCIELDGERFVFPPPEIATANTTEIMKFLCHNLNVEYIPPQTAESLIFNQDISKIKDPFTRHNTLTWEEQEATIIEQEKRIHKANQEQREKFLSTILQEQVNLDFEIAKVQEEKEIERQKLIKAIQADEKEIDIIVNNFIQSDGLNPDIIQQQLAYEKAEHDRLLEITRQNYDNIRKADVLRAMQQLIVDQYSVQYLTKDYKDNLNNIKENLFTKDLESTSKLTELLNAKEQSRFVLMQQLLEDQEVQKAVVTSLLERVDSKSWSLNQEISLISSNLAKISVIEQEKKKLHIVYNYNELLHQRIQLVNLLDDLFDQRNKRKKQLLDTIKEVEIENDMSTDFWVKNYQKLLDSAPKNLLSVGKNLDPLFANFLLQEEVIHCLPFLVKFLFSDGSLLNITADKLKNNGVTLSADRTGIIRAINKYLNSKQSVNAHGEAASSTSCQTILTPSAPFEQQQKSNTEQNQCNILEAECVICMDSKSEVVFVPCGHMCCCQNCGLPDIGLCPMCRTAIERKIKVLIS